ncbi:MAG: mtfA protein [Candidatus Riflebacteria bacterium]|nr:mtfA protein [Candidatus Riflebacteria bacterium]
MKRKGTLGVLIGDKHTLKDWNLGWVAINLGFPEAKTYEQDVPGTDGTLDITEAITPDVKFKNRNISLEFETLDEDFCEWGILISDIANYIAGRRFKIILDTDPGFYYIGRLNIDVEKTERANGKLVISGDVDPYKYERYSSLDDWLFDDFNFENGIIREYKDLEVNGTYELFIIGRRKRIIPVIECSAPMSVVYKGVTYSLPKGKSKAFDIYLNDGENVLTFKGKGIVSVEYRGGSL